MRELFFQDIADARGNLRRWTNRLARKSGVYVIREKSWLPALAQVLYVGESHSNRLKDTLTRHFRKWTGKTAGTTYPRTKIEVAVVVTFKEDAVKCQNQLIRELDPRDNIADKPGFWEGIL